MSEDTRNTPERPDPPLEKPDLTFVSSDELANELRRRHPTAFLLHMESNDEGGREPFLRMFHGDWAKLAGVCGDLHSYTRSRVRRLYPRVARASGE